MTDTIKPVSSPKPRRRWLRWLSGLFAVLVVLLLVAYLVATSSGFFKAVILPRVGSALNATITVSDASIHPFSGIILRDLKVQAGDQPPLVSASEVRVSYHLFDILHSNLHVDEIALVSPTVELVENPDGSSNLDPILKALQTPPAAVAGKQPAPAAGAAKPLQIDLGKLTLSHATLQQIKNHADGSQDFAGLTNVDLTLTNLKNGQTAKLELAADVRIENNSATNASANGVLAASVKGDFNCAFTADLKPGSAGGSLNFSVSQAGGAFSDFDAFGAALDCEVTPAEIKQLALSFQKAGAPLGKLAVTGPFDAAKMEGRLDVALHGIDRRLLNLAGAGSGLDFGGTQIDSTNEIELAKGGAVITATGRFTAGSVALTRAGQTTPTLDVSADYDVTVDRPAGSATLRSLNLAGTQNGAPLLNAQLTSPMTLAWGGGPGGMGDAAFDLAVTGLNLADWKPFLGDAVSAGTVGLKLKVSSHQAGKQIGFDLNTDAAKLTLRLGSNQVSSAAVVLNAHGQAAEFKQIALSDYTLQVSLQNQPALTAAGSGNYDLATGDADAQVKLTAALARLLQAFPQPGMNISSGEVELNARVTQKQKNQTLAGDLSLANFSAQVGKNEFLGYASQLKLDVAVSPEQIQINQATGSFSQNGNTGGSFDVSGKYQPAEKSADVRVKFSGVNENALRPYLEPLLAGKKLGSVSLNGDVLAQYNPQAGSAVKGDVQVANLVVNDPAKKFPATPLAVGLQLDAALLKQTAAVRQFQISLTPTALATNQLQFSGQVDFSKTDAIQGNLKLAADSLDLTSYYDLFAGGTNAAAQTGAAATVAPTASGNAGQEPAAVHLPLQNFTLAADIGKIYLHEVAVSKFQTTVKMDGGHVVLKPFQLALNDAPVTATADVDLGVPGYKYNISYDAQNVPLTPLVDTFAPARAGQMAGTLTSAAQISGAGITGASLQKNLAGQFSLDLTNLNLSVINVHSALLKSVINVVATIPELISNPANAIISLLSGVTGHGGLMNDLQQSPIEVISAEATVGNGKANLSSATVQSAAFEAEAAGDITLNSVLTNSTINIPVNISVSQAIAQKLNLTAPTASASGAYVPLPQFLNLKGTIGNPKTDINKLALVGVGVKSIGGSLLNPSGNNPSPVGNLLNQLLKPH
jgi:uncharacterized protein involved in outer membrane biogenesis